MRVAFWAGTLAGLLAASPLSAATYIPVVPVAGAPDTRATAINDRNAITGVYFDDQQVAHGFAGTLAGDYQTFDFGTGNTVPFGIDKAGEVAGASYAAQPDCSAAPFERTAKGKIKPVKRDGKKINGGVLGMDAAGDFVGYDCGSSGTAYRGKDAKFVAAIQISGVHLLTMPSGINAAGTVVGSTLDTDAKVRGFILSDGTTITITYPGASQTQLQGINDAGLITGTQSTGGMSHAFIYDMNSAKFTSIEPSGATSSIAGGINKAGLAAVYSDHGAFIYCPKKPAKCPH